MSCVVVFFCGLPPANCGLRLSGPEILYTLLEALQVDMIKYNKYTHFICLKKCKLRTDGQRGKISEKGWLNWQILRVKSIPIWRN